MCLTSQCAGGNSLHSVLDNMDIQTLLYNLRDDVSCPVCSDLFTDPKQLSCLHSFCLKCLEHWYETSGGGNSIKCPKCQCLCRVPASGDLKDLPTSFYLNGLIDVLAIKECHKSQVKCGNCEEKSSEASYCFQCCIFYCEQCAQHHNFMRSNKDHRILAIKEFQDQDYEDVLKRPVFCLKPRHKKEELKYFCKNCGTAVCQACVTLEHSGHALEHIEDEAERQKAEMKDILKIQRQNLEMKKNVVSQLDEDRSRLIRQSEAVKRDVQKYADRIIAVIEAKKQSIFVAVENQTKDSLESVTMEMTRIENEIKSIESSLEQAAKLVTQSTNAEIVELKKSFQTSFEEVIQQSETIVPDPESLPAFVFVESEKLLETVNTEEIGSLEVPHQTKASQSIAEGKGLNEAFVTDKAQFMLTTRNSAGRKCYNKRDCVTVEIRDERGRECVTQVRITDYKNGQYSISYSPREQGRYSIISKVNGNHVRDSPYDLLVKACEQPLSSGSVSAQAQNTEVPLPSPGVSHYLLPEQGACSQTSLVKPFQFKPVLSFGKKGSSVGMLNCPWGVAVSDTDEIAVADQLNHRVQIFDSDGNFSRSFGRQGNKEGEFWSPVGITFGKNRNIYVADNWNHRIQTFSGEGEYVGMFGGQGSLHTQLCNPCGLSTANSGNIIVADADNKLIKIFSSYGTFVKKMGGQRSFSFPVHCVHYEGYLIVSDRDGHCIKVFDGEGKFQYKFGNRGAWNGEFKFPGCLTVNKSGQLVVCDSGNDRLQVFQLDGKFLGSFGTKGSNLGEFNNPRSVAVLSNGQIVVSDCGNNRIQIIEVDFSSPTKE